jgi:hypothetical protein
MQPTPLDGEIGDEQGELDNECHGIGAGRGGFNASTVVLLYTLL